MLNSLLYLTLLKVDYKEVIYGANINGRLLANAYLLQAIVVILMVVSLSSNLVAIRENEKELPLLSSAWKVIALKRENIPMSMWSILT